MGDQKLLIDFTSPTAATVELDRLGRRHLTMTPAAFTRLVLGHTGLDVAMAVDGVTASTTTALDVARVLFPRFAFYRSPLDAVTA